MESGQVSGQLPKRGEQQAQLDVTCLSLTKRKNEKGPTYRKSRGFIWTIICPICLPKLILKSKYLLNQLQSIILFLLGEHGSGQGWLLESTGNEGVRSWEFYHLLEYPGIRSFFAVLLDFGTLQSRDDPVGLWEPGTVSASWGSVRVLIGMDAVPPGLSREGPVLKTRAIQRDNQGISRDNQVPAIQVMTKRIEFRFANRKKFFTVRVLGHWNRLLREAVDAPSLKVFKAMLDGTLKKLV
ncbi:hypothetical protein DUI87_09415 [Hirundo rustica rustica]|uniref:Uncharacterized protein n=1 Tax=Hirundo rustica rustica TaxID=333673 RepID=A0A3M0KNV1_HIRRU|nr:hypothetical protein DUI87_09415 [Hirundo rustica rustica]